MSAPLISPPTVRGYSLSVQGVSKRFGGLLAVNDVSLEVRPGEIFSVIGPNGAGKTTFFNLLTGIYTPDQGKILLGGEDITGLSPDKVAAKGVGRTFQNIRLFGAMTVLENVLVGHHIHTLPIWPPFCTPPGSAVKRLGPRPGPWSCSSIWA